MRPGDRRRVVEAREEGRVTSGGVERGEASRGTLVENTRRRSNGVENGSQRVGARKM